MKTVKITIDPVGKTQISVEGAVGTECETITAGLERALAGEGNSVEREYKPEYHESAPTQAEEQQHW